MMKVFLFAAALVLVVFTSPAACQPYEDSMNSWINVMNNLEHRDRLASALLGGAYAGTFQIPKRDNARQVANMATKVGEYLHGLPALPDGPDLVGITVAMTGSIGYAHYSAGVYDRRDGTLHFFDSGSTSSDRVYEGGNRIRGWMERAFGNPVVHPHDSGLPMQKAGDSFCQTWSLLFVYRALKDRSFNFFDSWRTEIAHTSGLNIVRSFIVGVLSGNIADMDDYVRGEMQDYYRHSLDEHDPLTILRTAWQAGDAEHGHGTRFSSDPPTPIAGVGDSMLVDSDQKVAAPKPKPRARGRRVAAKAEASAATRMRRAMYPKKTIKKATVRKRGTGRKGGR